ncbi:single-stranded DNA-binding protein [Candidatus Peregrinibacteria bacterium]|nr:single-stranded DNA-binding protein [Candidatus Peregrinibacteria bacterium]
MRSINKVILVGNLTRDPETRETPSGQKVVTFGIATNREWVTKDGRKLNSAEYHDLVAWAKLADICSTYLKKGKLVYVEGYLKTRSWDTPEGTKKFRTEIVVQDMIMLDKRSEGDDMQDYIPDNSGDNENYDTDSSSKPSEEKTEQPVAEPKEPTEEKPTEESSAETPQENEKEEQKKVDIDSDLGL